MIAIPEELLEQFEHGNVLLFIGEQLLTDPEGRAVLDELTTELIARTSYEDSDAITFPVAAQLYQDQTNRQALVQLVRERISSLSQTPQPVHQLITSLTDCRVLVTTCIDQRLEQAFKEVNRPLDVVVGEVDIAFEDARSTQLYKLRGSIERPDSLILTEDDYEQFFENQHNLSIVLQAYLARRTTLFVGYDLGDPYFKRLYRKVTASLDEYVRRSYAFSVTLARPVSRWCARHDIQVVEVNTALFLQALVNQLANRSKNSLSPQQAEYTNDVLPTLPDQPYKLLDYYESTDVSIFFGRKDETRALSALIHAHRLVVLYGVSGAGKTSLLLAGVVPLLEQTDARYKIIYVRALEDPAVAIQRAVQRLLPEFPLPVGKPLVEFLAAATAPLQATLMIILDQFEEFFIRLSPQFRAAFIQELGSVFDARDLPVKLVFSLREDWLAALNDIEQRIPSVFRNRLRLLPLSRQQAQEAITRPLARLHIRYEMGLVEQMLDDLVGHNGGTVMPPQLQLVCSALFKRLHPSEHLITRTLYQGLMYKGLSGVRGVLQEYLDDELKLFSPNQRSLAHAILQELITSQKTKAVKTQAQLALALNEEAPTLAPVLERLVKVHILRVNQSEQGEQSYELTHEYLIEEIDLEGEAKKRKEAEELVQQELANQRRFGTLLAVDKLLLVYQSRSSLRLNNAAEELLLHSALVNCHETSAYWLERLDDQALRIQVLHTVLADPRESVRAWTAQVMGAWSTPKVAEMLVGLLVNDSDASVRRQAALSLAGIDGGRFVTLMQEMLKGTLDRQQRALEAVASVQDKASLRLDAPQLDHLALQWRLRQLRLQRNRGQRNHFTFWSTVGGALGSAIGGAIGAALALPAESRSLLSLFMMLSLFIGLVIGAGAGWGYGSLAAMNERRKALYVVGAALGGGFGGMVVGLIGDPRLTHALLGGAIGLAAGMTSAGGAALVMLITAIVAAPTRRLAFRLAAGGVVGLLPGIIFVFGHELATIPAGLPYGLSMGVLMTAGLVSGLAFAERNLMVRQAVTNTQHTETEPMITNRERSSR